MQRQISGYLRMFADLPQGSVLLKASLGTLLYIAWTFLLSLRHSRVSHKLDSFGAPNILPRASHRKHLTLTSTKVPHKRPQNQCIL